MRAINLKSLAQNFTSIRPKIIDHIHVSIPDTLINNWMDLVDHGCLNFNQIEITIHFEVVKLQ